MWERLQEILKTHSKGDTHYIELNRMTDEKHTTILIQSYSSGKRLERLRLTVKEASEIEKAYLKRKESLHREGKEC